MSTLGCNCSTDCITKAIFSSVIIGIVAAILTFTGIIVTPVVFLWVAFGVAVLYIAILVLTSTSREGQCSRTCVCRALSVLLGAILGTILISVVLLLVTFPATSGFGAIITGALYLFFSLIITSSVCLIKCKESC